MLRYAAFNTAPIGVRSWVIRRWLWELTCHDTRILFRALWKYGFRQRHAWI